MQGDKSLALLEFPAIMHMWSCTSRSATQPGAMRWPNPNDDVADQQRLYKRPYSGFGTAPWPY